MKPRPLELFDLPKLPHYRSKVLTLDSRRALTRGNPLCAANFLAYLNPKRRIYTGILDGNEGTVLGGISQRVDEGFARLVYLAPAEAPFALIDHLTAQAGKWQAHQIVAEIDVDSPIFESLRHCGFAVYGRQRIWNLSNISPPANLPIHWREQMDEDLISIQSLEREIIPPLLQMVETFSHSSTGMLCKADELLAYMDVTHGPKGIFLRPLIHPNTDDISQKLLSLLANLPNRRKLPIYLCVCSHQAWIELILEEIGASMGMRQAVMVKHLTKLQREEKTVPRGGNAAWANPAAPINGQRAVFYLTP